MEKGMKMSQNSGEADSVARLARMLIGPRCKAVEADADGGVGGAAGMKKDGMQVTVACGLLVRMTRQREFQEAGLTMIDIYKTMFGISEGLVAKAGSTRPAKTPPNGFAREATAVALTRPRSLNHTSLYLVGALRTKG